MADDDNDEIYPKLMSSKKIVSKIRGPISNNLREVEAYNKAMNEYKKQLGF